MAKSFVFAGKKGYRVKSLKKGSFAGRMYKKGIRRGKHIAKRAVSRTLRRKKK